MAKVKLKVQNGVHIGKRLSITSSKFLIGRAEDCHLRPGSDLISRHHCAIVVDGNYVGLRDFGSRNGTFVNEEPVVGECELKPGDRIRVGPLLFEVEIELPLGKPKRPAVGGVKDVVKRTAEAAASQSEQDAESWLDPENDEAADVGEEAERMEDTGSIDLSETMTNQPANLPTPPVTETIAADIVSPEPGKKGKPAPGKLPPQPVAAPKDSSSAAADILRQLSRRR